MPSSEERKVRKGQLLLPSTQKDNPLFECFMESFRKDQTSNVAKNDSLIRRLAQEEFNRHGHDRDKHDYVRQRVRRMAKLLLQMRSLSVRLLQP